MEREEGRLVLDGLESGDERQGERSVCVGRIWRWRWRADVEMERGGGCESSFSMLLVEKVVYLLIFSNNLW